MHEKKATGGKLSICLFLLCVAFCFYAPIHFDWQTNKTIIASITSFKQTPSPQKKEERMGFKRKTTRGKRWWKNRSYVPSSRKRRVKTSELVCLRRCYDLRHEEITHSRKRRQRHVSFKEAMTNVYPPFFVYYVDNRNTVAVDWAILFF